MIPVLVIQPPLRKRLEEFGSDVRLMPIAREDAKPQSSQGYANQLYPLP
jgi:hypothetical protein